MLTALRKFFIKDYTNVHEERVRLAHGSLGASIGLLTNLLLVLIKGGLALYLFFLSDWTLLPMALLADALNNLSDLLSCLVLLIGFKASGKPADKKHPFGHERAEYIAGLLLSVFVLLLAFETFVQSIEKLINNQNASYDLLTIALLAVSILLKLFQGYCYYGLGKAIDSKALKGSAIDSLSDVLSTTGVLVGAILSYTIHFNGMDAYLAFFISFLIFYAGIRMLLDSMDPILGLGSDPHSIKEIEEEALKRRPNILGCHDILIHSYGPTKKFISFHIEVPETLSLKEAHAIADELETTVANLQKADVTIHVDPVDTEDPEAAEIEKVLQNTLKMIEGNASLHDFRLVRGKDEIKCLFDILLPFESLSKKDEITKCLEKAATKENPKFRLFIRYDHPF